MSNIVFWRVLHNSLSCSVRSPTWMPIRFKEFALCTRRVYLKAGSHKVCVFRNKKYPYRIGNYNKHIDISSVLHLLFRNVLYRRDPRKFGAVKYGKLPLQISRNVSGVIERKTDFSLPSALQVSQAWAVQVGRSVYHYPTRRGDGELKKTWRGFCLKAL